MGELVAAVVKACFLKFILIEFDPLLKLQRMS